MFIKAYDVLQKYFVIPVIAFKGSYFHINAYWGTAHSAAEAEGSGLQTMRRDYQVSDGYKHHGAYPIELTQEEIENDIHRSLAALAAMKGLAGYELTEVPHECTEQSTTK